MERERERVGGENSVRGFDFDDFFSTHQCVQYAKKNKFCKVGLQIPDELLIYAFRLVRRLEMIDGWSTDQEEQITARRFIVLGDSSFGSSGNQEIKEQKGRGLRREQNDNSCCVDETTAQHGSCDFILHFGFHCFSQNCKIPTLIIPTKLELNVTEISEKLASFLIENSVAEIEATVIVDSRYLYCKTEVVERLSQTLATLKPTEGGAFKSVSLYHASAVNMFRSKEEAVDSQTRGGAEQTVRLCGQELAEEHVRSLNTIIYIGFEPTEITRIALEFNHWNLLVYHPIAKTVLSVNLLEQHFNQAQTSNPGCTSAKDIEASYRVATLITSRYANIEKAKEAVVFGILISTLSVAMMQSTVRYLRELLSSKKLDYYTFFIGKLNPQKLANFPNIDVFVYVACANNSLINTKDYFRPIITPLELQVALGVRQFSVTMSLDIEKLEKEYAPEDSAEAVELGAGSAHIDSPTSASGDRQTKHIEITYDGTDVQAQGERSLSAGIRSSAAEFLLTQTFQGMDFSSEREPAKATMGQTGIASQLRDLDGSSTTLR